MHFAGKSLYALGQLIVLRLPNIVVLMLLARVHGADAVGLFSLAITYLILLTTWWVGLDELVIRETARSMDEAHATPVTGTVYRYALVRVAVAGALYLAVAGALWWGRVYAPASLRFIAVLLASSIADGFTGAVQAGLVGRERFGHAFAMSVVQTGLRIAFVASAIWLEAGLLAVAWAWTAGAAAGMLVAGATLHVALPAERGRGMQAGPSLPVWHWVREGWAFLVIGVVATLEYQQDMIVLSGFRPLSDVGYYSVATTLFAAAGLPVQALRSVLFPQMARVAAQVGSGVSADADLRRIYAVATQWLLALGLLLAFLGIVYAEPLIRLLFGAEMIAAAQTTRVLMAAMLFFALNVPQSRFLLATGRQNRTAALITASTLGNLLANLILVRHYGATGAALARNVSTALYFFLAVWTLSGAVSRPSWPGIFAPVAALLPAAGAAWATEGWLWWLSAPVAAMAYAGALAALLTVTKSWNWG